MKKIIITTLIALAVIAVWLGQRPSTHIKDTVAIVNTLSHPALDAARLGFIEAIKPLGLKTKDYNAEGNVQQANLIAQQIAHDESIVAIFAIGTLAAQTVAKATKTKPIIIAAVSDVAALSDNLPENLCGLTDGLDAEYQINTIKTLVPHIKSVSLLYTPHEANSTAMVKKLRRAAKKVHLITHEVGVYDAQGIIHASIDSCKKADAVLIPLDNQLVASMPAVIKATKFLPCPIIASNESPIHQGAAIAFGVDYQKSGFDAGMLLHKIINNQETPKSIGIIGPKSVTLFANERVLKEKNILLDEHAQKNLITIVERLND